MPRLMSSPSPPSSSSSSSNDTSYSLHHLLALFILLAVLFPLTLLLAVSSTVKTPSINMTGGSRVLGYIIFHRHGHRAPARNVLSASFDKAVSSSEEQTLWLRLMPSESLLRRITTSFELDIHDANPIEPDRLSFPFGAITSRGDIINQCYVTFLCDSLLFVFFGDTGINHLIEVGEKVGARFPLIKKAHQVDIVATNYQRTQLSVQAMLTGLGLEDITERNMKVKVRDIQHCAMSFYEGNPRLVSRLFREIQELEDFQRLEEPMNTISAALLETFPLMAKKENSSKIDWLAAFDYFACRDAHNLSISEKLTKNTPYSELVQNHMANRMAMYLRSGGEHIKLAAGPLLRDMKVSSQRIAKDAGENQDDANISVHIYSGHDVNILGLLYALEADPDLINPPFWPGYGSSVIVEVLQQGNMNLYYETEPLKIRNIKRMSSTISDEFISTISAHDLDEILGSVFLGEDQHQRVLQEHRTPLAVDGDKSEL